jgi:hypothetical protein
MDSGDGGLYTTLALSPVRHGVKAAGRAPAGVRSPVPGAHRPTVGLEQDTSHPPSSRHSTGRGATLPLHAHPEGGARATVRHHAPQRRHQADLVDILHSDTSHQKI